MGGVVDDAGDEGAVRVAFEEGDDDGMQPMRARAERRGFPFPYVRDDSQTFVRGLGARFTPEVFVFDAARKLRYHGRIASIADGAREAGLTL